MAKLILDEDGASKYAEAMPKRVKRVVIYGGTELPPDLAAFVSRLTAALLRNNTLFVATGGFKGASDDRNGPVSTDVAVRDGARTFAGTAREVEDCLETWLPDPGKDRTDVDPHRFDEGRIQQLPGFSAQARRLKLVQSADGIVTIRGHIQSMLLLESALVSGRPALPLPFTGGDSRDHWLENRPHYLARLSISADQAERWESIFVDDPLPEPAATALIDEVVSVVNRMIGRKCLVLMPFSESFAELSRLIRAEGFHPIRLDQDLYTGDVRQTVQQLLNECDAIIADVTKPSPNVMYEVGLAHAHSRAPLLIWHGDASRLEESLPFYLKPQRIVSANEQGGVAEAVKEYLQSIREGLSTPRA